MMREEFYHSQYGDPDHHVSTRCHVDYEEGVEYIEAGGEETKVAEINTAHESFLWLQTVRNYIAIVKYIHVYVIGNRKCRTANDDSV